MSVDSRLINAYQSVCRYKISDGVQSIDVDIDVDKIQKELLDFIVRNRYGTNSVSLRIHKDSKDPMDFVDQFENVLNQGISIQQIQNINLTPVNIRPDSEYVFWHPDLQHSYTKLVTEKLEQFSGLKIGRIRLVWLLPKSGYPMHVDLEPMRFHIPLVTNKHCYFIQNDNLYHMAYGKVYHLLTTTEHTTQNFGDTVRLHLIFSTYSNDTISNTIKEIINEKYSINNYVSLLANSGINQNSLVELIQLDYGYKQKYLNILDKITK